MSDPFTTAASAAGIISLGLTVTRGLLDYYDSYKDSGSTVTTMYTQLEALASTLALLSKVMDQEEYSLNQEIGRRVVDSIESCRKGMEKLEKKLIKIRGISKEDGAGGLRSQLGRQVQKAMFPFKESTLVKLREMIIDSRNDVGLVLNVLQIDVSAVSLQRLDGINGKLDLIVEDGAATSANVLKFGQDIEAISDVLSSSQLDEERRRIHEWLRPPDPYANHSAAREKHVTSTNEWLLRGADFRSWLDASDSLLVLYGIPGSGKTIIASSIIAEIEDSVLTSKSILLYYYFDFNDRRKQTASGCLSSLILQLALVMNDFQRIWLLYTLCEQGRRQPTMPEMEDALRGSLEASPKIYLVLDALDECQELDEVLGFIISIFTSWDINVKLLATTRKERNIDEALQPLKPIIINLQDDLITDDIQVYVTNRLTTNLRLKRWCLDPNIKSEIESTLVMGADGMFRWVVCQLDELQKCLTAASLKKTLRTLPKTLYETYDRVLLSIDPAYHEEATQILQWLVVCQRPLYIEEAAETVAMLPSPVNGRPDFDADNRLSDPNDIFQICLSLVSTTSAADSRSRDGQLVSAEYMRLAHYSVKNYLTSEAISQGPCSKFYISEVDAHACVARACIAYLLHIKGQVDTRTSVDLPLADYAADHWDVHAELGRNSSEAQLLHNMVIELLMSVKAMLNVQFLNKPHYPADSFTEKPALHWAIQYGLADVVETLASDATDINVRDSTMQTALHVAIRYRRASIAQSMLQTKIDINARDIWAGTALHYALHNEDVAAVIMLLQYGADPNIRKGTKKTTLYLAAERNNQEILKLLLEHGADPNAHCEMTGRKVIENLRWPYSAVTKGRIVVGTPLQVAAWRGYADIVAILLDAGAVVKGEELHLLARGQVREALQAVGKTGAFPYHFNNELPDYTDVVRVLQANLNKDEIKDH